MNTDYLKYDASSLVEYLRKKLLDSGVYTDQIYPASDLKLLIDLFAWTFEVVQYILNNNAADVLFNDTTLYENMNRLTKMLSYSPKAYRTSTTEFSFNCTFDPGFNGVCIIPKYASVESSSSDSNGNPIAYSFTEDFKFTVKNGAIIYRENPVLSNGSYCRFTFPRTADGSKFEAFAMKGVGPNAEKPAYIDNDTVEVFVETVSNTGEKLYQKARMVNSLILEAASEDLACEKRLNDNKEFEIKFGDGVHGKCLEEGSVIHVIYLRSNGEAGKIEARKLIATNIFLKVQGFTETFDMISMLFGGLDIFKLKYSELFTNSFLPLLNCTRVTMSNLTKSSDVLDYEDVNEIRENAPSYFRMGQRLVTKDDFRTYILTEFKNRVTDAYVCNNNEYVSIFYKWLDKYDKLNASIRLDYYTFADAVDFNNIYIWLKPARTKLLSSDKKLIVKKCNEIKSLTTNLVPLDGIKVSFFPYCLSDADLLSDSEKSRLANDLLSNSEKNTKILVKKRKTYLSDETIRQNIAQIIVDYFNEHDKFGDLINFSELAQQITSLEYVDSIKTATGDSWQNGLSFCSFTKPLVDFRDFEVNGQYYALNSFQYASLELDKSSLYNAVQIDDSSSFNIRNDEF